MSSDLWLSAHLIIENAPNPAQLMMSNKNLGVCHQYYGGDGII
jgi:hypothetical protein